ncbi:MAG: hypothetical protein EAZ57_06620 [Cytophagales bacterium]|nr:MAG: hypothetical protein EAZ67_07205 [Cytophagales bacterium]TAF60696.1 MAG: hypothetical protein EAZ57_06620 [Cytophagales bacterium]
MKKYWKISIIGIVLCVLGMVAFRPMKDGSTNLAFGTWFTRSLQNSDVTGDAAPEIALLSSKGDTFKLSSLKGKVVLIDFWASWCGPCREANPEVVRLYKKYKGMNKNFEILGVSLDNKRDNWIQAIAKDHLAWPQVSDLKGWTSVAAETYGVNAIPYTVIVDTEGNIVARKLKGRQLEMKLDQLLGVTK